MEQMLKCMTCTRLEMSARLQKTVIRLMAKRSSNKRSADQI